jgi:hypothetical protein
MCLCLNSVGLPNTVLLDVDQEAMLQREQNNESTVNLKVTNPFAVEFIRTVSSADGNFAGLKSNF